MRFLAAWTLAESEDAYRALLPELEGELKLDGVSEIEFDFSALEYISSAGLRVLMTAQKAMMACDGKMTVTHPNATVKDVFDMTGMSSIFTIV